MGGQLPSDPLVDLRKAIAPAFPGSPAIKIGVVDGLPDLRHPALSRQSVGKLSPIDVLGAAAATPTLSTHSPSFTSAETETGARSQ